MPLNLIKTYNSLLELDAFDEEERNASLMGIFKRDFVDSGNYFRQKKVLPTLSQGKNTLSIFFNHLVTMEDRLHRERIYDRNRAVRLHWIKYHLEERQPEHLQVFSVKDKVAIRTYLYDVQESYVIPLKTPFHLPVFIIILQGMPIVQQLFFNLHSPILREKK